MLQFYQKRSLRGFFRSWGFVGVLAAACFLMVWAVYDRYTIAQEMSEKRVEAESGLAELQARKAAIEDKVKYLGSERGVEAEMRRNFDVAQPGEQVVIIVDPKKSEGSDTPSTPPPPPPPKPWYLFWE
jgi:cell division protein FtsB